jgi:copper transport protein
MVLVGVVALVVLPAAPASAHAVLLRTAPSAGGVVADQPARVTLTFNEAVRPIWADIGVVAPDGHAATSGRGRLAGTGSELDLPLRSDLARGTYLVSYRVISADSHPVAGGFSFSIGAPSRTAAAATGGSGAAENPVVAVAMPVARYLGFAGLVLLVGPAMVLLALWPRRLSRRGPARLLWLGFTLVALATVVELYLEVPYSTGGGPFAISGTDVNTVLGSRFGWAHVARLAFLGAAAPMLAVLGSDRRNRLGGPEKGLLAVFTVLAFGTWGYGGHPGTSPVPPLTVVADAVHLGAVSVWLGGLIMLVGFLLPRGRPGELAAVLPVWSRWATRAVVLLAAAGITQAALQLGSPAALVDTSYGLLLVAKTVAFAAVLGVASFSRGIVRRSTALAVPAPGTPRVPVAAGGADYDDPVWDEVYGDAAAAPVTTKATRARAKEPPGPSGVQRRALRRLVAVELAVAAVVLGLSSVLVQTTPARSGSAVAQQQALAYSATLDAPSRLFSLQVQLDPARVGSNTLHLVAYHATDGSPVKVLQWQATAALPGAGIQPITVPLKVLSDNHAYATVALPRPGDWQFAFTARTSDIDEDTVSATVPVR